MNRKLFIYTVLGIVFVIVWGSLSHFFYEWSNENTLVGLFSPVNESTWEHMKMLFFPMFFWILFMRTRIKDNSICLTSGFYSGLIIGLLLIPAFFYTYSGILGKNYVFLDILTFILSTIIAFCLGYRFTKSCRFDFALPLLRALVFLFFISFLIFSFHPLALGIFQEP